MKHKTYLLVIICLANLLLSSCGFRLRGDYLLPSELQTVYVSSEDSYSELTRLFKQYLSMNKVTVLPNFQQGIPEIRLLKDTLDRRTLSVFSNGQVAEYELIYTVRYQVRIENQEIKTYSFELNRDYQDDPNVALAKSRELNLMLKEMRHAATDKILRNMASIEF